MDFQRIQRLFLLICIFIITGCTAEQQSFSNNRTETATSSEMVHNQDSSETETSNEGLTNDQQVHNKVQADDELKVHYIDVGQGDFNTVNVERGVRDERCRKTDLLRSSA